MVSDWVYGAERAINEVERAAYERGLRRGMAIAGQHQPANIPMSCEVDWDAALTQMEREIEEAKR